MNCWLLTLGAVLVLAQTSIGHKKVVCYYGSWAVYRPGDGKFDVEAIDPTLCTHLIYTFVGLGPDSTVKVLDSWNDLPNDYGKDAFGRFNKLKLKSPGTKTMVAIGGWNEGSTKYSDMVNNDGLRKTFIASVIEFLKKWEFDGFDLDWEYPNQRGGKPSDVKAYSKLIKEMREEFDKHGYLLSAAVGGSPAAIELSYEVPELSKYLHWINIMSYDMHGAWDTKTGENSPLYPSSTETTEFERTFNIDAWIKNWIAKGAAPEKLVVGMATYGRSFTLQNAADNGLGAPITGPGAAGEFTREPGMLGYNEICTSGWTVVWDDEQKVPRATSGNQWVGYDDVKSITLKSQYVMDHQLGGAMIWSLETDDFHGKCGQGPFPLLHTINSVLNGGDPPPTDPTKPTKPTDPTKPTEPTVPTKPTPSPTQPPPPPDGLCKIPGSYVRDPKNCRVFYLCDYSGGKWNMVHFECGPGEYFDTNINACNYENLVEC